MYEDNISRFSGLSQKNAPNSNSYTQEEFRVWLQAFPESLSPLLLSLERLVVEMAYVRLVFNGDVVALIVLGRASFRTCQRLLEFVLLGTAFMVG